MGKFKKICVIIATITIITTLSKNVYADALSDYKKQLLEVQEKQKQTAAALEGIEKEIANYIYDITVLDSEITLVSMKLQELQNKVNEVTVTLQEQEALLQNSAQAYNSLEDVYKTRLRVIYENGIPSMFDILVTSNSITDFFSKASVLKTIVEYDKSLVSNLKSQKEYVAYVKQNIEFQKTQLEQLTYDTERSKETLELTLSAKENKVNEMKSSQTMLEATAAKLAAEEEETSKNIRAEILRMKNEGTFTGQFFWPVPGFNIITATMGYYDPWGTGNYSYHSGTDISGAGISGTPIYAMESGTVSLARWYGAYGNCVIINHGTSVENGKSYRTLYAHAQSLAVSQGQAVSRGQVIAYVGSTGNSTGAHLHVEVYENDQLTSALRFFESMNLVYR